MGSCQGRRAGRTDRRTGGRAAQTQPRPLADTLLSGGGCCLVRFFGGVAGGAPPAPPAMGMQGMELCAVAVVILLFIAVLKQFGILEPISAEGNPPSLIAN